MAIQYPFFRTAPIMKVAGEPPVEWVDPSSGHRVVRLTQEPGSQSLYFHQNAFPGSDSTTVFQGPRGLCTVNIRTREVELRAHGEVSHVVAAKRSHRVYFLEGNTLYEAHVDRKENRAVANLPAEWTWGAGLTLNADETLLAGTTTENGRWYTEAMPRSRWFSALFEAHLPTLIYTVNIKTGEIRVVLRGKDWFNHIQFSPTDPGLVLYCHEGPWHKVDRIWTVRIDGSGLRIVHERTMAMEIVGHEFWNPDGRIIWYDQQTPKGKEFWLGGTVLATGEKLRYRLNRDRWSVHYNVSWDGKLFAGDGSSHRMVAKAKDGKWIYLYHPQGGELKWKRLVNMANHDYGLEPNVMFTPDGQWVVFRSNMHGKVHAYAVEVFYNEA